MAVRGIACLAALIVLVWAADAFAQGKGKGGFKGKPPKSNPGNKGGNSGGTSSGTPGSVSGEGHGITGGMGSGGGVLWLPSVDQVPESGEKKKYIFVYVRTPGELRDPAGFQNLDLIAASKGEWSFVKMDLDPENPSQKLWGITRAPCVVGCDLYRNDFKKAGSVSPNTLRAMVASVPKAIYSFKSRLRSDHAQAVKTLESNRSRGIGSFVRIVLLGKKGYKEIEDAVKRLDELGAEDFKQGELTETATVEKAVAYYQQMVTLYKTTPVGLSAEVRIARLENDAGRIPSAIQRIHKVLKVQGHYVAAAHMAADALLVNLVSKGDAKIDAAVAMNAARARTELRKIAKEYAETAVARRALEELRQLK